MILSWTQRVPELVLNWVGPNTIQTTAIASMPDVEEKIAVISGPRGIQGIQGNDGTTVGADAYFSWSPPSAQDTWTIAHNMSKFPSVTVVDSTGRLVTPEVTHLNISLVEISFAFATSGTAYLN